MIVAELKRMYVNVMNGVNKFGWSATGGLKIEKHRIYFSVNDEEQDCDRLAIIVAVSNIKNSKAVKSFDQL